MGNNLFTLRALLERVSYKPNVTFELDYASYGVSTLVLKIAMNAPDAIPPHRPTVVYSRNLLPAHLSEKYFIYFLEQAIKKHEDHEFKEWFKLDGRNVFDPHPELELKISLMLDDMIKMQG
jgi:hypothetical protein